MMPDAPVPVVPLGPRWLLKYSREPSGVKAGPQISEPPRVICISSLAGWSLIMIGQAHGGAVLGDQHVARRC